MSPTEGCNAWRETAFDRLPEFRALILASSSHLDMWWSMMDIVSEAGAGGLRSVATQSIFDYAWWCVAESGDEWLAAEVSTYFYENLAHYSDLAIQVQHYVPPWQFRRLEQVFAYHLSREEYEAFRDSYFSANRDEEERKAPPHGDNN